ncbi:TIGR02300 family protein [Methylobacterium gnaphalii]|uniref:TIGR02300 family protein n=1 Tax=Methylobacterium gnaphalii TaxID=1010610 RepID=A0A512JLS1_9HYPH|nr:TIGR02300 family protein [Methylobacterium gnaphalii]GEP10906.1 hypothetical protein MGN01_27510 [Methylobacterium gnaphalii]GJD68547.1 hypothetical protein MMMDOFMJ_1471 [Methylobacterium gnaphalii]GLS50648.1 hypothetical protein GCM10007885_35020 [Methylobacterium gnaphalii]
MARPELGIKRQCMNCGAKFYDLSRDPATCPKCGTVFQMAAAGRGSAPVINRKDDDEEDEDETGPEIVSLDEAEASEDGDVKVDGDDDGDDDTDSPGGDDDTFLEEEDDDDVSDLVENDDDNDDDN